jgi:predicted DNA-binding protein with PD1-like motif
MKTAELTIGRTFCLLMENGDDFFESLRVFCEANKINGAYVPGFLAGFSEVTLVGRKDNHVPDLNAPVWESVTLNNVEAIGAGTIARDDSGNFSPHIHVSVGEKFAGAKAYTSHLLGGKILFLSEMILLEVLNDEFVRRVANDLFNVKLLSV